MPTASGLERQALATIAHRCADETERFFRRLSHDPRFCFELFRRALVVRVDGAWELIYQQYLPLVSSWVERHSAFAASGEEVQYFVNRAFEKMWQAVTPRKFGRFPELKSLLRYLQMCVHSVVLDQVRVAERSIVGVQVESRAAENRVKGPTIEDQALGQVRRQEFWDQINARLRDEKERLVVYGSFVLALKPRELYAQFRETFCDVNQVYRVKENVLARLRRDAELCEFLGRDV